MSRSAKNPQSAKPSVELVAPQTSSSVSEPASDLETHADGLFQVGRLAEALRAYSAAMAEAPDTAVLYTKAGVVARRLGRLKDAETLLSRAVALDESAWDAWNSLGNIRADRGDRAGAIQAYERALELNPTFTLGHANICRNYLEGGLVGKAVDAAKTALADPKIDPTTALFPISVLQTVGDFAALKDIHADLWGFMGKVPAPKLEGALLGMLPRVVNAQDRAALFQAQSRWGEAYQAAADKSPLAAAPTSPSPITSRGTKLRVGFLSSDIRQHNVAKFVLPILEYFDRRQIELHCYSSWLGQADRIEGVAATLATGFKRLENATQRQVAEIIRADGMDVVIEMNGLTRHTRAPALAWQPAPVQVEWLGYPYTMGMRGIGHFLVDRHMAPTADGHRTEELITLSESWICLDPRDRFKVGFAPVPPAEKTPAEERGHITFGTLNKPYKFTPALLQSWGRILARVPGSKLLIARPEAHDAVFCDTLIRSFADAGVDNDRLVFATNQPGQHLTHYNAIDIALDTFPQVGGTTTCEALWMGCPTVSLVGDEVFERMGLSILTNAGLADLCAETVEGYENCAVALAEDHSRLTHLRATLREAMTQGPLGQVDAFVESWERALIETRNGVGQNIGSKVVKTTDVGKSA